MQAQMRALRIASHLIESSTLPLLEAQLTGAKQPIRVAVTGAAGQIGYALLPSIVDGTMFGPEQPVILNLLEVPAVLKALDGVVMELTDGAYPLLVNVVATSEAAVAFKDVDAVILVGSFPRKQGMERADLLNKNASIFEAQGKVLNQHASRNVKVLVVGNPANTNCLICSHFAPSIPRENFSALTRLDQHRAQAQIAAKAGVAVGQVKNVVIWGNHSATQYPDASNAVIMTDSGTRSVPKVVDKNFLQTDFIKTVQQRGAAVIAARGSSSALSAARAITAHMRDWWLGTRPGEWVSMGVVSDGSYGVPAGLVFSYPVTISNGKWQIVKGLEIDSFSREKLKITADELIAEKELALKH